MTDNSIKTILPMNNSEEKVDEMNRLLDILSKRKRYSILVTMLLVFQKYNFQKLLKEFLIEGVQAIILANPFKVVSFGGVPFTIKNCSRGMRVIIGKHRVFEREVIEGYEYLNVNLVYSCIFLTDEIAKICQGSKNNKPVHSSLLDELDIVENPSGSSNTNNSSQGKIVNPYSINNLSSVQSTNSDTSSNKGSKNKKSNNNNNSNKKHLNEKRKRSEEEDDYEEEEEAEEEEVEAPTSNKKNNNKKNNKKNLGSNFNININISNSKSPAPNVESQQEKEESKKNKKDKKDKKNDNIISLGDSEESEENNKAHKNKNKGDKSEKKEKEKDKDKDKDKDKEEKGDMSNKKKHKKNEKKKKETKSINQQFANIFYDKDANYFKSSLQDFLTVWNFEKSSPVNTYLKDNYQNISKIKNIFILMQNFGEKGINYLENLIKYIPELNPVVNLSEEEKKKLDENTLKESKDILEKVEGINTIYKEYENKKKKLINIYQRIRSTAENIRVGICTNKGEEKLFLKEDLEYLDMINKRFEQILDEIIPLFNQICEYYKENMLKNISNNMNNLSRILKENDLTLKPFSIFTQNLVGTFQREPAFINTVNDIMLTEELTVEEREKKFRDIISREKNSLLDAVESFKKYAKINNEENKENIDNEERKEIEIEN